jgi:hypothetical protein
MPAELLGWVPQTGALGLLLLAVWAVLSGRIIPRKTHEDVRHDRDTYRTAALTALAASAEMSGHVAGLTAAVGQLTTAVQRQADTQQETLTLVRRLAPGERGPA